MGAACCRRSAPDVRLSLLQIAAATASSRRMALRAAANRCAPHCRRWPALPMLRWRRSRARTHAPATDAGAFNRADRNGPSDCATASRRSCAGAGSSSRLPGARAPTGSPEGRTAPARLDAMRARRRKEWDGAASWGRPGGGGKKALGGMNGRHDAALLLRGDDGSALPSLPARNAIPNSFVKKPNCTVLLLSGCLLLSTRNPASSSARGVAFGDIAAAIGRHLQLPVGSVPAEAAPAQFGWMSRFASQDVPTSSAWTRERLGWQPTRRACCKTWTAPAISPVEPIASDVYRRCRPQPQAQSNCMSLKSSCALPPPKL
ncbi:hypothetical protein HEP74_00204 [Xanthomonas sp. SS]|nr:hypothetical protein HEP74_00204 [Xanthomonas sp. SS]